ncbi:MAG: prepilin-type N-terminal cleavage/methylation domain-containing protein [Phycisphaeraceae bacterium]|nr:prepilin-type N-terminal cleavage/methylation domain-containing protein [Phycisphaeraceae bacterium]
MSIKRTVKRGFTLVEILIVVVILGILAAIVVPQFTNAANEARGGNLDTQISTIQNQIELFRAREGAYPTLAEMQAAATDDPVANPSFGGLVDGDYLKSTPRNPYYTDDADATEVGDVGDGTAWEYDEASGELTANEG